MPPRFEEVIAEHGPALWRLTAGWARGRAAREDLYQEILIALWRALPRFRGESRLRTYVFRIAHNRCLSSAQRTARDRTTDLDAAQPPSDPSPGPERQASDRQQLELLRAALRRLPMPHRQVLLLRLEGLSQREIAEVSGISENNVAVRVHRARIALRDLMSSMAATVDGPAGRPRA